MMIKINIMIMLMPIERRSTKAWIDSDKDHDDVCVDNDNADNIDVN